MNTTIASISTPLGKGAISIVRMSGQESLTLAKKLFSCRAFVEGQITPRFLYLGNFDLGENIKEKCLCVYFKAPNSYTGEDMVEFQVHGGSVVTQKVLDRLISAGAILAQPGEFSRRAFENGKVTLDEAEAIIDEINAESESELKASLSIAEGKLKAKIRGLQSSLTEEIAQIEATLDYPEEDFEKSARDAIVKKLGVIKEEIQGFVERAENSRYIQKGINIAIIGAPNVGKSSILNSLVGSDRAIVTDIAGTTRDIIEEQTSYKGLKFNFIDTAGIREASDKVEKIGIEKSRKSIENADIVLLVFDGSRKLEKQDREILDLAQGKNTLIIINKIDKPRVLEKQKNEIEVSAVNDTNIDKIKESIYTKVVGEEIDFSNLTVTNERQIGVLKECLKIVQIAIDDIQTSMDILAMHIKALWNELGKITGECENERIIDMIFSKFCLGK